MRGTMERRAALFMEQNKDSSRSESQSQEHGHGFTPPLRTKTGYWVKVRRVVPVRDEEVEAYV